MNTSCEKCIFADTADSSEPCKFGIIDNIKTSGKLKEKNNFYYIEKYRCPYAFSIDAYKDNKDNIGSISDLESALKSRAFIRYYFVIEVLDTKNIENICNTLNSLPVKPCYVSIVINQNNDTKEIIDTIKAKLDESIEWKLHNFLENISKSDALSTIMDTNIGKNDTNYMWYDSDLFYHDWSDNISKINNTIVIQQPECSAMFRNKNKDGLFSSFSVYQDVRKYIDSDIFIGFDSIKDGKFIYYG